MITLTEIYQKISKYWVIAPLPVTTYGTKYLDPFMNASWDFSKQAPILISVYGDTFGGTTGATIVTGSWFVTIIALYWLRQEDVVVPMFMTIILANIAMWTPGIVPEEWKLPLGLVMIAIPFGALLYSWIVTRKD
jgi:hypothetical protein